MPETCRSCGAELSARLRLRLVREDWLPKTRTGEPGYAEITIGCFCDHGCLWLYQLEVKP